MNIFFLDKDLNSCATYHVDKHVVKMRLELAQIACTVHHLKGTPASYIPYKPTHIHHPSVVWASQDLHNYLYVVNLGLHLCEELKFRFNTKNQKVLPVLEWLFDNIPCMEIEKMTKPLLAMDEQYKIKQVENFDDAVMNYRNYYKHGKTHLFSWKNRSKPDFLN